MRFTHQLRANLRAVFRNSEVDSDLAEEMRFHLDRETAANISRGMSPAAAKRAARLSFGSVDVAQEESRDQRPGRRLRQVRSDLEFGVRLLMKAPAFGLAAVAIIALTIGAATAVFSVVYGVMLQPLPFRDPQRLVSISLLRGAQQARVSPSAADVVELRQLTRAFDDVAMFRNANLSLTGDFEPRRLEGSRVSPNLFSLLGVSPQIGRTFAAEAGQAGNEHVVLLSDALWRSRFAADSAIVGRTIQLDGLPYTVSGVMPPNFLYPATAHEAWVPLVVAPDELTRTVTQNYRVVARLAPGASLDLARQQTSELAARLARELGVSGVQGAAISVDPMLDDAVRDVKQPLNLLLGAVAFLVCLACANLANLFAARASARTGEFAVRLALGASRARLMAQAVAEAFPVIVIGGVLGILAAQWALRLLVANAPAGLPRLENVGLNAPVAAMSLGLLALSGLVVSIAPVMQAWHSDFSTVTRDGGRSSTTGHRRATARRVGVATQVAFALPLLVVAALLVRSAINLSRVDPGFSAEHVAVMSFEASRNKRPTDGEVADYYAALLGAVKNVPGVESAALTNRIPLLGAQSNSVHFETANTPPDEITDVDSRTVSPDYFETLGIKVIAGRSFTDHDAADTPTVCVVDERVAITVWPGENAVGKRLRGPGDRWCEVIGVVRHVRTTSLEADPRPQVYWSFRQWTQNRMVVAIKSRIAPQAIIAPAIAAIRSVDADQPVYEVRTLEEIVDRSQAQRQLTTVLIASFGLIALLLAAIGVYGVVAFGVAQRMREFGIRTALGATSRQITSLVLWQGTSIALAGAAIGLILAIGAANIARSLVYGIATTDITSIAGATLLLVAIAALASYLPARRAAHVQPATILRGE